MAPMTAEGSGVNVAPRLNSRPGPQQRQRDVVGQQLGIEVDEGGCDQGPAEDQRTERGQLKPKRHAT